MNTTWFVVLCMGRSGSTYLTQLLDSHDDIVCLGEAFGPGEAPPNYAAARGRSRRDWLIDTLGGRRESARGFKLPIQAVMAHPALLGDLEALSARVILLTRHNTLAHFVSMKLAQATNEWTSRREYAVQRVEVDPWELVRFLISSAVQYGFLTNASALFPRTIIDYEHLSDAGRLDEVQRFLGVTPARLTADTLKARTVALRDSIVNFDQVMRVLEPTPWAADLERWAATDDLVTRGSPA